LDIIVADALYFFILITVFLFRCSFAACPGSS